MLYYYDNLLYGMELDTDYGRMEELLRAGHPSGKTWLVTLSSNINEQLDLFPAGNLFKPFYRDVYKDTDVYIIAIADGEQDAIAVVKDITEAEVRQFDRVDYRARFPKEVFAP